MPFLTPDEEVGEVFTCRVIRFPASDGWRSIVDGALSELIKPSTFEQIGGITAEDTAAYFDTMFWDYIDSECEVVQYPPSAFIPGNLAKKTSGAGTITTEYGSTYALGQRTYLSSPAVGNKWEYHFSLAAGRYEMRLLINRVNSSNGFTVDWKLDNVLVVDNLSFLGGSANVAINTTVDVLTDGNHILEAELVAQTGSATIPPIHYIHFVNNVALP